MLRIAVLQLFQIEKLQRKVRSWPLSLVLSAMSITVSLTGFPVLSVKYSW